MIRLTSLWGHGGHQKPVVRLSVEYYFRLPNMASIVFHYKEFCYDRNNHRVKRYNSNNRSRPIHRSNKTEEIALNFDPEEITQRELYEYPLTKNRSMVFAVISFIMAAGMLAITLLPTQYAHWNTQIFTKEENYWICDQTFVHEQHNFSTIKPYESLSANESFKIHNESFSNPEIYSPIYIDETCRSLLKANKLSPEICFGILCGLYGCVTMLAGFRPNKTNKRCCLVFGVITLLTSLILICFSIVWHSFMLVICIIQGLVSIICLVTIGKDSFAKNTSEAPSSKYTSNKNHLLTSTV